MKQIQILALVSAVFLSSCGGSRNVGTNLFSLAPSPGPQSNQASKTADDPYFEIVSTETKVIDRDQQAEPLSTIEIINRPSYESATQPESASSASPLAIADLILRAWNIVVENKPVVNLDTKAANALPHLAKDHWQELTGWKPERWIAFSTVLTNKFGMKVIELNYKVRMIYGGSARGKGLYIASAQVMPSDISVLWGFHLNVNVDVVSVINAGTDENPVGQITLNVVKQYGSTFNSKTDISRFTVNAAGLMKNADTHEVYFPSNRKLFPAAQE